MNKLIIIGRLGSDAETRAVNDTSVSKVSVATSKKWKDKKGETQEDTQWHNVEAWGGLSDVLNKYAKKGERICIVGEVIYETFEDSNKVKKYSTKIRASEIELLGSTSSEKLPF